MTPLAKRSAIGRYSIAAVRALSGLADVDVFYPTTGDDLVCADARANIAIEEVESSEATLARYDAIFYNLGNYLDYHSAIFEQYLLVPGIPVLHDKVMQGFFVSCITRHFAPYHVWLMHYLYGARGRRLALDLFSGGWSDEFEALTAREFPLFEPCLINARGVVVHSRSARGLVSQRYGDLLPVAKIDLPTFIYDMEYPGQPLLTRDELGVPDDVVLVVVGGRMNPTKRLDVVISAVAGDPELCAAAQLVFVGGGDSQYLEIVQCLARDSGLGDRLRLVLHPDDREMHSYLAAADVCINLRNPSTESASASLVEQLHFGKPVIVTRTGVYDEVPDDVVVKTDIVDEVESVRQALHRLVFDGGYRAQVASAAREYASCHHSPEVYARELLEFVESLGDRTRALVVVDEAAEELTKMQIDSAFDAEVDRLAQRVTRQLWKQGLTGADAG